MLPNLLIIGAAKSGTTSLHEYLALHPEIAMSEQKELQFFIREDWRDRVAWYESQFPDSAAVGGESTPTYSMFPFQPNVAERAHQLIPDARLIYVVRDPVVRAVAQYVELYFLEIEDRPIAAALGDVDDASNPYLCASSYATQLERYLEFFDPSQILIVDHEDLLQHRERTLEEIFRFLEVDPTFTSAEFERMHNTRTEKMRYSDTDFDLWLKQRGIFTERVRSDRAPVGPLRELLSRPIDDELTVSVRESLIEVLRPEVQRLRKLTGKGFSSWSSFPDESENDDLRIQMPSS